MSIIIRIFGLEVLHIHLDQLEPADTSPGDAVSNPVGFVLPMHEVDMPDREL